MLASSTLQLCFSTSLVFLVVNSIDESHYLLIVPYHKFFSKYFGTVQKNLEKGNIMEKEKRKFLRNFEFYATNVDSFIIKFSFSGNIDWLCCIWLFYLSNVPL